MTTDKRVFALLIISLISSILPNVRSSQVVIPTALIEENIHPGIRAYVMYLFVGTPAESLTFEITFKHSLAIMYRNQHLHSVSYTTQNGGSEVFYFGTTRIRVPIVYDPGHILYNEYSHCIECNGMIGLGPDSFFWKLWPDASFSVSSIIAGGLNPLMQHGSSPSRCKGSVLHCNVNDPHASSTLCLFEGTLSSSDLFDGDEELKLSYPIQLSLESPVVRLPVELYDRYMATKNLYADDVADWPALEFEIPSGYSNVDINSKSHIISRGIDISHCQNTMRMRINPSDLLRTFEVEGRALLIEPNFDPADRTVTIGNSIWNQFIVYRSADERYLFVQEHVVNDHISPGILFLFAILFWYLIRWKMTVIALDIETALYKRDNWLNMLYELTAPLLALVALVLPITQDILSDFPVLYALSIALFVAASFVEISIFIATAVRQGWKNTSKETLFAINYMRNLAHETLLMIALWVLIVSRRTEGIATILTVVINIYNLYNISYHFFLFFIYVFYVLNASDDLMYNGRWFAIIIGLIVLLGFQLFATYNYFTAPLLMRNAQIYEELIVPILVVILIFVFDAALYMVSLYITRGVRLYVARLSKSTTNQQVFLALDNAKLQ